MRDEIHERQNSDWALDRLAAQRLLYGQAKSVGNLRLALMVLVAVLLLAGLAVQEESFSQGATIAVLLLWFIDQVALVPCAGRKREEAATIQEDFDCRVLDIAWPDHVGVARPTGDRVRLLANQAQQAGATREGLTDWYRSEDIPTDPVEARLYCQRVNCRWDSQLREEWIRWVWFAVAALTAVALVVGVAVEMTVLEVVLGVAAGTRLLAWLLQEQRAQSDARKRMDYLHGYLSRGQTQSGATPTDVRLVQAAIFHHRRISPSVPDWYHRVRRQAYEGQVGG